MTTRRGFALMASVWLMVAIAAVAFEVSWLTRVRRLAAANVLEDTQARAASAVWVSLRCNRNARMRSPSATTCSAGS